MRNINYKAITAISIICIFLAYIVSIILLILLGQEAPDRARQVLVHHKYTEVRILYQDKNNCPDYTWRTTAFTAKAPGDSSTGYVRGIVCSYFMGRDSVGVVSQLEHRPY